MREQERLFAAIGGVDEALLERSEKRTRRGLRMGRAAGIAACLILAALVWALLPESPAHTPEDLLDSPNGGEQAGSPSLDQETPALAKADGQLHLLSFGVELEEDAPLFSMYLNEEAYDLSEQGGTWVVRPWQQPDFTPECKLEITHVDLGLADAVEAVKARLEGEYASVAFQEDGAAALAADNTLCSPDQLLASNGVSWDDAQQQVWFADDGSGGTFVFEASYFLEAEEGHGARFRDMVGTFAAQTKEAAPQWIADLRDASERLFTAVFAGDLTGVADLLAPEADIFTYSEDLSGWMSVGSIDYSISVEGPVRSAIVSVKHRDGAEEPYRYLTMKFSERDGQWLADRVLLEK